jgi:hypothetical protein
MASHLSGSRTVTDQIIETLPNGSQIIRRIVRIQNPPYGVRNNVGYIKRFPNGSEKRTHIIPNTNPTPYEWGKNTHGRSGNNYKKQQDEKERLRAEKIGLMQEIPNAAPNIEQKYNALFSNLRRIHNQGLFAGNNAAFRAKYQTLRQSANMTRAYLQSAPKGGIRSRTKKRRRTRN